MSKLVSEADKLLEKGKFPEAIEKLTQALRDEPLNQLIATKLANVYVDSGAIGKAAKVYTSLAHRLSEAGKNQVALAIFKQAIELDPNDIDIKIKFAQECELGGKLGDAQTYANQVLQFFLRRKKYFDAVNLMPLLVRIQPKDEKIKFAWIEMLQFSQAEQKLVHLLVALCGPPGVVSPEFSVGGDPIQMSPALYQAVKNLVPFFPRDPKIAYAVAWVAHRRGAQKDFYHYLHECLRREPDFCLGLLLFARVLAENQKLNESLFIYKYIKERMPADKSIDLLSLNRLIENFVEKNGWISFTDGMGVEELDARGFLEGILGKKVDEGVAEKPSGQSPTEGSSQNNSSGPANSNSSFESQAVPAEIELSLSDPSSDSGDSMAVEFTVLGTGAVPAEAKVIEAAKKVAPTEAPKEAPKEVIQQPPAELKKDIPLIENTSEVQFTSMIQVDHPETSKKETTNGVPKQETISEEKNTAHRPTFDPLAGIEEAKNLESRTAQEHAEKTQIFSPMDVLAASDIKAGHRAEVPTKLLNLQNPPAGASTAPPAEILPPKNEFIEGDATKVFSPVDAVKAVAVSQKAHSLESDISEGEKTQIISMPSPAAAPSPPPPALAPIISEQTEEDPFAHLAQDGEATQILNMGGMAEVVESPTPPQSEQAPEPEVFPEAAEKLKEEANIFTRIPEESEAPSTNTDEEVIDLGEDLLEGPTRPIVTDRDSDSTQYLIKEMEDDLAEQSPQQPPDLNYMFSKAERFIAKRNYYLARKLLRHTLALGGDEEKIKNRLRDIRRLEIPDGVYNSFSTDKDVREKSSEILDRLEIEFNLNSGPENTNQDSEVARAVEQQLDSVFSTNDPRTIMDFGIGLHEMGLFHQAESLFARVVLEYPAIAFDAYYLASVSKFARKDYAGAVSILKKLSTEGGKSDLEKIQIYYSLGELFEKMQRPERSKEFYKKVAELDANYRNIRSKLGD